MRVMVGAVAAGIAMFMWGFVFWGLSPATSRVLHPVADEAAAQAALAAMAPETGVYMVPYPPDSTDAEVMEPYTARHEAGPVAHIFIQREGVAPMGPGLMLVGLFHMICSALIMALGLSMLGKSLATYRARFMLVLVGGIAGTVLAKFSPPIWFYNPWDYHVADAVYLVFSWTIAGGILAAIVKPVATPQPDAGA